MRLASPTLLPAALLATALLSAGLAGCATPGPSSRESDLERLRNRCTERDGVLVPSGAPLTGRVETDFVCNITGGASRIR